jgi:hypothetical protein
MRVEDILPLSPLQEGLLFHALYDPHGPDVYTVQLVLGLDGPLDKDALEAAVQALVRRHSSLRAGFEYRNLSRPVQVVLADAACPVNKVDLSALSETGQKGAKVRSRGTAPPAPDPDSPRLRSPPTGCYQPSHRSRWLVDADPGA